MAALNFIYAGRVYLDESKETLAGYWGISLALNCHLVYTPDQLNARTIAEFEKADHELDYILNKPTSQLYRLTCTEHTDLIFSQKGVFTLVSNIVTIPYLDVKVLNPTYKYKYSAGFGIADMVKNLMAISLVNMGDPNKIFAPNPGPSENSVDVLRAIPQGTRKRFIMLSADEDMQRVAVPYGITGVSVSAKIQYLVLPETVEFLELRSPANIEYVVVVNKYFTQNLLYIDGNYAYSGHIQNLQAPNTDTIILDRVVIPDSITCNSEVIFKSIESSDITTQVCNNKIHSRLSAQYSKPRGIVV